MFVNLKLHTDYSLLEGVAKVEDYIEKAKSCLLYTSDAADE